MKSPTIKAVAAEAGVSVATVSYVLSGRSGGDARVREETRQRVLAAATRIGYQPNQQARSVRRGRTEQVCLVLRQLDSPWARAMADEVSRTMREIGYSSLILLDGDWSRFLLGRGADGALIDGPLDPATDGPKLRALAKQGISLVVHSNDIEPDGFDVVRSDEQPALTAAMDLLTSGHRRIACLRTSSDDSRYAAYRAGLDRAGLRPDGLVRDTANSRNQAYRQAVDLLESPDRPTAIFACTDLAGTSAIHAAHRLGLTIPDDLAIIGVGNTPDAALADPPLTSVGAEAIYPAVAQLLLTRLQEGGPGRLLEVPWAVHRRVSC